MSQSSDVRYCYAFQRSKDVWKEHSGILRPFPPPKRKWKFFSMDFLFHLSLTARGKSNVAAVVDTTATPRFPIEILSQKSNFLVISPNFDVIDLDQFYLH